MNYLNRFLAVLLLCLSWLLPSHFLPWVSWHSEAAVFTGVFLLALNSLVFEKDKTEHPFICMPYVAVPLIGLLVITILQRMSGLLAFWGDVWVLFFYVVLCIVCLILGFRVASDRVLFAQSDPFTILAVTLVIGATASTAISFVQAFSLWEQSEWILRMQQLRRPGGNLGQPNQLATLMVMGVASLVYLNQRQKIRGFASGLLFIMLFAGLSVTESRAGALSMLALLGWWLLKYDSLGYAPPKWMGIVGIGIFAIMFLSWPKFMNAIDLLGYQAADRMSEGSGRFKIWPQLVEAIEMRPWIGWGFHQVAAAHNAVVHHYAISEPYSYSHNVILDSILWFGIPVAAIFTTFSAIWLWRRARDVKSLLSWYCLAVALPLGVHSMLEFPFAYAYFLAPVSFLLGALEATADRHAVIQIGRKSAALILLSSIFLLGWSAFEYLKIEEDFRVARFESSRIGKTPSEHQRPKVYFFDQLEALSDDARIKPGRNMSTNEMNVVKSAALYYPWLATQYRYAVALALNHEPVEAARQFQVMRVMWGAKLYAGIKNEYELLYAEFPELTKVSIP